MKKAYGRLDIFWPEGRLETFILNKAAVQVGRAAGNDLILDYDGVDAAHLRLEHQADGMLLSNIAAEMETFVDGVAVDKDASVTLHGGEELQLGSIRIVYRTVDDSATLPMAVPVEDTQRIESDSAPFRIELQLPQITVVPGSYISVELSVTNTGRESERFNIDVMGVPGSWVRVNRPVLVVESGDTSLVMINLRPTRHSDSRPGDYPVTVIVTPDRAPQAALRAMLTVHVQPFSGFGIAMGNSRLISSGNFRVHLHNHGSGAVALRLVARDKLNKLNLRLSQSFAQLGPGERVVVSGTASSRDRRIFGTSAEYPFEIIAHADAMPRFTVAVPGRVVDRPPLPAWSRLLALTGVLLAFLLILYGAWGLLANRRVTPEIISFTTSSAEVVRGQPVTLMWSVRNAETLRLSINDGEGIPLTELQNGVRTFVTDDYPANTTFALIALNGEERVESDAALYVYTPVSIEALNITPPVIFRNVVQSFSVEWRAQGYSGTPSLRGLDVLGQAAEISLDPANPLVEVGPVLPTQNFTLRLVLTDERGVEVERTRDVILADPQCTSARPNVPVLVEPSESSAVLSRVANGVVRVVTGRTTGADFLAVRLENGGEGWVRAADFVCPQAQFRVQDLREIPFTVTVPQATQTHQPPPLTIVPTATPSHTPTPSASPTPLPTASVPTLTATP